jgi:Tfp pilus assembly protein PilF
MRPQFVALALAVTLGSACTSIEMPKTTFQVQPVQVIRHAATDANAHYQLGRYHQGQNRLDLAEGAYLKVIEADNRHVNAYNALATIYAQRGEFDRAATAFKRVTELGAEQAPLLNNIGYALLLEGKHHEAVDVLRKAVALSPEYDRAWINLKAAAELAGMTELADMAAQRRLPDVENQPSRDAGSGTLIAEGPTPVEPQELRLAMTPTLKVLTEPTTTVTLVAADETWHPVVSPVSTTKGPDVMPWTLPKRSVSEDGDEATTDARTAEPAAVATSARVEISNGNGVGGFATRVSRHLRQEGVRVSRITNYSSYRVERSYIECGLEWNSAAHALRDRLGAHFALRATTEQRLDADIRVVLGRDSILQVAKRQANPKGPNEAHKPEPLLLTLLTD